MFIAQKDEEPFCCLRQSNVISARCWRLCSLTKAIYFYRISHLCMILVINNLINSRKISIISERERMESQLAWLQTFVVLLFQLQVNQKPGDKKSNLFSKKNNYQRCLRIDSLNEMKNSQTTARIGILVLPPSFNGNSFRWEEKSFQSLSLQMPFFGMSLILLYRQWLLVPSFEWLECHCLSIECHWDWRVSPSSGLVS